MIVLSVLLFVYFVYCDILEVWKKRINVESMKWVFYMCVEFLGVFRLSGAFRRASYSSIRRRL